MRNWFEVDRQGLAKILERKGKEFALFELVQNCWDEPGVTKVSVTLEHQGWNKARLVVEDDAPEGFKELSHAFTLFADSAKKANPEQRGRFNLGEKLVLAISEEVTIRTTQGSIRFDAQARKLIAPERITTVFNGEPLTPRLHDKAVFYYVPVSEVEMLSNPRFVSFWVEQTRRHPKKHKLAILEDAEELLLPRDAGSRDKVSNLLNIADGFLGDHLKLHVVATTNVPINKLDAAIVRPGRLIGIRKFRRLNRVEALRLAEAKGLALADQPDFSLAELYCGAVSTPALSAERQIGFAQ